MKTKKKIKIYRLMEIWFYSNHSKVLDKMFATIFEGRLSHKPSTFLPSFVSCHLEYKH